MRRTAKGTYARIPMETRFWEKVAKGAGDECWLWLGTSDKTGYARVTDFWDKHLVHRYSYELHVGPIPEGMQVCHTCDVRLCVNPAHLFLGTALDNNRDKAAKGRQIRGEQIAQAKLTDDLVREIRRRYAEGFIGQAALGAEYGVGQQTVSRILSRTTWAHVED